ncbi:uncharacterized protein LOC123681029 [Harmonia axyridis]|uniref:uncharacterized protein LOC123681029 n=1 Tax=Harmonia axyridis TaxID=115357 RepID=UPI001E276D45|nr:uncharacterized protein LOC123681029 [Harmonia axyridis]
MENSRFANLLQSCGLEDYIEKFTDEGIDDTNFELLHNENDTLKEIFPKIGPRMVFKKMLSDLRLSSGQHCLIDVNQTVELDMPSISSASTISNNNLFIEVEDDLKSLLEHPQISNISESPALERIGEDIKITSLFAPLNLEQVLRKDSEGRMILLYHRKLDNNLRNKLAKIIINEIIQKFSSSNLKSEVFTRASQEISRLFPNEAQEVYFTPYTKSSSNLRKQAPRGKLWSRYIHVKAGLRLAEKFSNNYKSEEHASLLTEPSEEVISSLKLLESDATDFPRLLLAWKATFEERRDFILKEDILNILIKYPILRTQNGIQLFESDFDRQNPGEIDIVYKEWPKVAEAIIDECKDRKIDIGSELHDRSTKALLKLPYLYPMITLRNQGKTWRPTRLECQESFFVSVEKLADLENLVLLKKNKLAKLKIPFQPFGAVIEEEYFVVFFDTYYKLDSPIRCLEALYKLFHALNLEYPLEGKHIWETIQELVFRTSCLRKTSAAAAVISDLKFHLEK